MQQLFLGVDGGQSHTEAVVADGAGRVLGRGRGGPSNHADQPGGRERLQRAIEESAGRALAQARLGALGEIEFAAAHCAMTGAADFKEEIIAGVLKARRLVVGHDAPAALAGALAGRPGVVVIAGTGSVAFGERADGMSLQVGGWGYLFGDEGSGFWTAAEAIRRAMREADGLGKTTVLGRLAVAHFGVADLRALAAQFYYEKISRDRLASFAETVQREAEARDDVARAVIGEGAEALARLAGATALRLEFDDVEILVAGVGGMFRGELLRASFAVALGEILPRARIIAPRFDPAIGSLLLAYRLMRIELTKDLLLNLEESV